MTLRRILFAIIAVSSLVVVVGGAGLAFLMQQVGGRVANGLVLVAPYSLTRVDRFGTTQVLATDADTTQYRFPAITPNGRHLAYIARAGSSYQIQHIDVVGGARRTIFVSDASRPFNLAFSPDARYLTFLATMESGLQLFIVPSDGSEPARLVAPGAPSYYAWRADSSTLLLHIGGHAAQGGGMFVYTPADGALAKLRDDPGLFQAPAYSYSGDAIFYIMQPAGAQVVSMRDTTAELARMSASGGVPTMLLRERAADLRLARSPSSDEIAVLTARLDAQDSVRWGVLRVVDGSGEREPRLRSRPGEQVAACFWSPNGRYIAYLSHDGPYAPDTARTLRIVEVATGAIRDYPEFAPSEAQLQLEIFFDAYLFGLSPWSPDSRRFAYGTADGIYVATLDGETRRAGDGVLGVWVAE
jgi:Tol biopolymer transport system component